MDYLEEDLQDLLEEALATSDGSPLRILRLINRLLGTCGSVKAYSIQERDALQEAALRLLELQTGQETPAEQQLRHMMNLLTAEQIAAEMFPTPTPAPQQRQTEGDRTDLEQENRALREKNEELCRKCAALEESFAQQERELAELPTRDEYQRLQRLLDRQREQLEQLRGQLKAVEEAAAAPPAADPGDQPAKGDDTARIRSCELFTLNVNEGRTVPGDTEHVLLTGEGIADTWMLCDLRHLKTVEISRTVRGIADYAFCNCGDVELTFRAAACMIRNNAFYNTTVTRITAPRGGNVEQYARAMGIPFTALS